MRLKQIMTAAFSVLFIISFLVCAPCKIDAYAGETPKIIVWDKNITLYENYTVEERTKLIVMPNVTISLNNSRIIVKGLLECRGESDGKILITIGRYQIHGESILVDGKNAKVEMNWTAIESAGIGIFSGELKLNHVDVVGGGVVSHGNSNAKMTIENSIITRADMGVILWGPSFFIVRNTSFSGGFSGMWFNSGNINATIENNTIEGFDEAGIIMMIWKSNITIIGNRIGENGWGIQGWMRELENLKIGDNIFENQNGVPNTHGRIRMAELLSIKVVDLFGFPIDGVSVSIYNAMNEKMYEEKTQFYPPANDVPMLHAYVDKYAIDNNGTKIIFTKYTVYTKKDGAAASLDVYTNENESMQNVTLRLFMFTDNSKLILAVVGVGVVCCVVGALYYKRKRKQSS